MRTRKQSESGFYHVIAQANGRQSLFETEREHLLFLESLGYARDKYHLVIHAWCLMKTHAHLIIEDPHRSLGPALRDGFAQYAKTLNYLRNHEGVVFHQRYWREPIETDSYLLAATAYVHNNPQAAGICPANQYRWSSYHDYVDGSASHELTHTDKLLAMVDGVKGFVELNARPLTTRPFPTSSLRSHLGEQELRTIAADVLRREIMPSRKWDEEDGTGLTTSYILSVCLPAVLASSGSRRQAELVKLLYKQGFTDRQIQWLTGFTYRNVQKITSPWARRMRGPHRAGSDPSSQRRHTRTPDDPAGEA